MSKYTFPDLRKCAVVTIDTQNDFSLPGAVAEIKGTFEVIPNMSEILQACRAEQVPIVHVIRIYKEDGSNVDICRKEVIESGVRIVAPYSTGADLVSEIMPADTKINYDELLGGDIQSIGNIEWVIYKPRWGAFYQTQLEDFLKGRGIDTLVFIGCNFPNCPRTSIYEASERDFKVIMIEDAISGVYSKGLEEMNNIGVHIRATSQFINEIKGRG